MTMPARPHHCLLCGTPLEMRDDRGHPRPTCPECGWIYYRNPVPAAGVLLLEPRGVLLVTRQFAPRAGYWCLPAGFMEYGETPEHCAVRETREETGLEVKLGPLFAVYAGFDDPRVRAVLILYTAERTGGRLRAGDDAIEVKYFPLARLPRTLAFAAHRRALDELRRRVDGVTTTRRRAAPSPARR